MFTVLMAATSTPQPQRSRTFNEVAAMPSRPADARITYGAAPEQFGELRLPTGPGPHPVVVLIHGGCWRAEYDITHIAPLATALADDGWAVWAIEYRRVGSPGGGWPGTFVDVGTAIDHLRTVAKTHPLDLSRVVVAGHSAGGHLALWSGARGLLPKDSPIATSNPLLPRGVAVDERHPPPGQVERICEEVDEGGIGAAVHWRRGQPHHQGAVAFSGQGRPRRARDHADLDVGAARTLAHHER